MVGNNNRYESRVRHWPPSPARPGLFRGEARVITEAVTRPVAAAGRILTLALANDLIDAGDADLVGMVRAHIAEPKLIPLSNAGVRMTRAAGEHQRRRPGGRMNTTLTAIGTVPGAGCMMRSRRADARLTPGGRDRLRGRGIRAAPGPRAGEAARWQRILDLLDPGERCGAWSSATFEGRPVVWTRAPHDAREEHVNAETGWRLVPAGTGRQGARLGHGRVDRAGAASAEKETTQHR